jgi:hypothetical protein
MAQALDIKASKWLLSLSIATEQTDQVNQDSVCFPGFLLASLRASFLTRLQNSSFRHQN